ncbi:BQ2448_7744 [Microbotryum intermedium]|uniref:BQ2448_7744 protein n=1 Tax=Microbotryum intermedium TaxID=269621 RepID=A0A238FNF8_9BASI|nr:BQ2448_7744 [Microbotryum intermedium]
MAPTRTHAFGSRSRNSSRSSLAELAAAAPGPSTSLINGVPLTSSSSHTQLSSGTTPVGGESSSTSYTGPPPPYSDAQGPPRSRSVPSLPNLNFSFTALPPSSRGVVHGSNGHNHTHTYSQDQGHHYDVASLSFQSNHLHRPSLLTRRSSSSLTFANSRSYLHDVDTGADEEANIYPLRCHHHRNGSSHNPNLYYENHPPADDDEDLEEEAIQFRPRTSRRLRASASTNASSSSSAQATLLDASASPLAHATGAQPASGAHRRVIDHHGMRTRAVAQNGGSGGAGGDMNDSPSTLPVSSNPTPSHPPPRPPAPSLPRSRRWALLFHFIQSFSVLPSFFGFAYAVHRFYSPAPLVPASSTWIDYGRAAGVTQARSTRLDWFLAGMWALACAYFSHSLARGLLRRWLVYYSLLPTIVRVFSLQAICWPLTLMTHRVLSFDQPVAAWLVCASTAAFSNIIQIWVTSNIVERKDQRGHQRWQLLSYVVQTVVGPPVRSEKYRKGERALSWKRVLWGTMVPFAALGWITIVALLGQQFVARYHGGGGVDLGRPKLNSAVGFGGVRHGLTIVDLDRNADMRIVILVTSSWTNRSRANRQAFRESSVLLFPKSSSTISVTYRFLLGTAPSPQTAAREGPAIEAEAAQNGDLLLVPAHDSYGELSKKIYEGWKWAGQLDVDYVFKTDDDILLRMDVLGKEFIALGRRREYWKGFAYWDIPAIKDASNKNADFAYDLSSFPPYTAGALHILSRDLVQLIAPPDAPRLFVMNEDQNLGLWLYPSGIRPIHDRRIQQAQVCENDMVAKHFGGQYVEPNGFGPKEMYANIVAGRKLCEGFLTRWCGVCYPSCRSRDNHWRDWGFNCDEMKGATLSNRPAAQAASLDAPVKAPSPPFILGSSDDPWVIPGLLSKHSSTFSNTDDWHLLHMLCWTTGPDTFQERHYQAIESIWAHEPRAVLFMMSTSLPLDFFNDYSEHGYAIHVVRIGGVELLQNGWFLGPQSEKWLMEWEQWAKGPSFYSHLTDYLRYLFLFKFGGTYLDMDAPWVRSPPDSNVEFIGADYSTVASDLDWTLDEDGIYLAPGVMRFRRGWTLFRDIMESAFSPRRTALIASTASLNGFKIVPSFVLYPRNWINSHELVKRLPEGQADAELRAIAEKSWSIHLFGKMTNHLRIQPGSIIAEAFERFELRIPRRIGYLSSGEKELGTPSLGTGLRLEAPTNYVYRSRAELSHDEVRHLDLRGSIDGSFDGLDLIFVRAVQSPRVAKASIRVWLKRGGKIAFRSSSARVFAKREAANASEAVPRLVTDGELGAVSQVGLDLLDASLRDVNVVLGSLVYVRSPVGVREWNGDEMSIEVAYGSERASQVVHIA